jgi:ABC-type multidrug transport system fused ATPase/permease subunit
MRESWKKYKRHNSPNDLFKAVLHAFRKEYLIAMCISVVSSGFELSTPFIIKAIIDFIQDPTLSNVHGFSLILLLIITQTVSYVL